MTSSKPIGRFTRFINEDNKIYSATGKVKPKAFYLRPRKEKTHISVYLTENRSESDIWDLGYRITKPILVGRADLDACKVYSLGLCIIIDKPSTGHAKLGPFPEMKSAQEKRKEMVRIASELANISNTKRYPPPKNS